MLRPRATQPESRGFPAAGFVRGRGSKESLGSIRSVAHEMVKEENHFHACPPDAAVV